jgi:hypothetical protein
LLEAIKEILEVLEKAADDARSPVGRSGRVYGFKPAGDAGERRVV